MTEKPKRAMISIGTTSIVLIFVLLCMLTFSVLSLVSARANLQLSQKSADHTTAYYEAENAANDILLKIIEAIEKHLDASDEDIFYQNLRSELKGLDDISFTGLSQLNYQVALGKNQFLNVSVTLSFDALANGNHYQITSWNTGSGYDWNLDDSLPLLRSDTVPESLTEE